MHDMDKMDGCQLEMARDCMMGFFYVAVETSTIATCWYELNSLFLVQLYINKAFNLPSMFNCTHRIINIFKYIY